MDSPVPSTADGFVALKGAGVDRNHRTKQLTDVMTLKTLKELRDAAPFKPFDVHLSDGRALTVATPDHVFFMPNGKEFLVVLPDGGFRFVDAAQVVSTGRNGARAKAH